MTEGMPVFIKVDEYKDIIDMVELTQEKVKEARALLEKLNELKAEEDAELEAWNNSLNAVDKKLDFVDRSLFEPKY
jgi:predicted nuclease with TOPRIM domain